MEYLDLRDKFISQTVSGKTFADVGGLWGTVNEKVSVAYKSNATSIAMIDVSPEGGDLWEKFHQHMRTNLGINDYQSISQDICNFNSESNIDPFDVVHCSGVLYHHPNPMLILASLRKITKHRLILTSAITQEVVENEHGRYQIPSSSVLFVPSISEKERAILKTYWQDVGATVYGITEKVAYNLEDFGPWWWLPTQSSMKSMCEAVGFKVLESGLTWNNNAQTLLLSV